MLNKLVIIFFSIFHHRTTGFSSDCLRFHVPGSRPGLMRLSTPLRDIGVPLVGPGYGSEVRRGKVAAWSLDTLEMCHKCMYIYIYAKHHDQ